MPKKYESYKVSELREKAKKRNIKGIYKMNKAELITSLRTKHSSSKKEVGLLNSEKSTRITEITKELKKKNDYIKIWKHINYRDLLKLLEPDNELFQMVLNIILVKLDVRKSTLIELNNFDKITQSICKSILNTVIMKMKMVKTKNTSYRYFVTNDTIEIPKTDSEIAELLGFECTNHDFSNQSIERVSYSIIEKKTNSDIYVEVCEKSKIKNLKAVQKSKVKTWNEKIKGILPYKFVLQIEDIPAITNFLLRDKYTDKEFVGKNIYEYKNILYNEFFGESNLSNSGLLIMDNFNKFIFIMDNLKKIDILYNIPSNKYPSDGFNTLITNLKKFEDDLINGTDNIEEMEKYLNILITKYEKK